MKRHGGVNILGLLALVGGLFILALLFFQPVTPTQVANQFMTALAKGESKKLAELSFIDGTEPAEREKAWEYTTKVAGPHYLFRWITSDETIADDSTASVKIKLFRNSRSPSTYDENFAIPLTKKDGKWLVDVRSMSRDIYPGLPR